MMLPLALGPMDHGDDADDLSFDSDALDDEFPLGDGVADLASVVHCPYCGEPVEIALDPGSGAHQEYIEDCAVCCRPWNVAVTYHEDGSADVFVDASDDQ
jgi:hypothetical protein